MDHDKASELLGAYARGSLDGSQAEALRQHLTECDECALELSGLTAVLAPLGEESLTDLERARLRKAVAGSIGVGEAPTNVEVIAGRRRPGSRIAGWLGAAALVVLVAVGIAQIDLSGSSDESAGSASGQDSSAAEEGAGSGAPVEVGGPDISSDRSTEALTDSLGASAGGAGEDAPASKVPARFDPDAGNFKTKDLKSYASTQPPFRTFANAYSPADAEGLRDAYLDAIQNAAPSGQGRSLIRTCAMKVLEQSFPIVPAYGAYGTFDGQDVLVLGFVYAPTDRLNRYLVWVWPRESCQTPVKIIAGRIVK